MSSQQVRWLVALLFLSIGVGARPVASQAQPADRDTAEAIKRVLETGNLDRQRAVLTLIPEVGLKGQSATATIRNLEDYLQKTPDEECKVLALLAYGKLSPAVAPASRVIGAFLAKQSPPIRRAAGNALVQVMTASRAEFGKPNIMIIANVESINGAAGGPTAVAWIRAWTTIILNEEAAFIRFGESCRNLMPLCATALSDTDDIVRASGAEGVRIASTSIVDVLPDPATTGAETRTVDPFEAKLKWLLLQPAFKALNEAAPFLANGIQSKREETRMAAVQAAEALAQAHALALASRRAPPDDLQAFVAVVPPENPLLSGTTSLLPAMTLALKDPSPDIRLTAAEAFENLGKFGRSKLPAVVEASQNDDLFVRWAATRTLGEMYTGATADENRQIVGALRLRVEDTDLDVAAAAINALARGGEASRPATDVLLRRSAHGDPDTCILAIRTLEEINADKAATVKGLIPALSTDSARVRRAALIYLGRQGAGAVPAIAAIRKLLHDPDEEVRKEAAKAILLIEKQL